MFRFFYFKEKNYELYIDLENLRIVVLGSKEAFLKDYPDIDINIEFVEEKVEEIANENVIEYIRKNYGIFEFEKETNTVIVPNEEIKSKFLLDKNLRKFGFNVKVDENLEKNLLEELKKLDEESVKVVEIKNENLEEIEKEDLSTIKEVYLASKKTHSICADVIQVKESNKFFFVDVADFTGSITLKIPKKLIKNIEEGEKITVFGKITSDVFTVRKILKLKEDNLTDIEKRVELHLHTNMSQLDALTKPKELFKYLKQLGHPAVAITDHGVVQAFPEAYKLSKEYGIKFIPGIEAYIQVEGVKKPYHFVLLCKNQESIPILYELVSRSHIENFYRRPLIKLEWLKKYRDYFITGSACVDGFVFRHYLQGKNLDELLDLFDYIELQPPSYFTFLGKSDEEIKQMLKDIYEWAKRNKKPVVATADVHYLKREHRILRQIIQFTQGFSSWEDQIDLHYRTTEEMLEYFKFLGDDVAREIVVDNSLKIAQMIEEDIKPIPTKTHFPEIEDADEKIKSLSFEKLKRLYGENIPDWIMQRYEKELNSIIKHGFSSLYLIASQLVKKSLEDGYLVGSRGSVGSSFLAYLIDITEVNPLPAHYRCDNCKYTQLVEEVEDGVDLPDENCPNCGAKLIKDGHRINFETFLGFEGDKVPDIDLNFSGEYQPIIQAYTEELFGKGKVFRAGTISTVAEKTAIAFVKDYFEKQGEPVNYSYILFLARNLQGVKRTTGQHPGGLMIVPKDYEIYKFSPVNKPANDKKTSVITTHFDYGAISGILLKLDLLGHDDPTTLRMLSDLTGVDYKDIPLDDKKVLKIFSETKVLGITSEEASGKVATLGIPEFGTDFVMRMLEETKPTTFTELVRISGLSHGTDVWTGNAQELIKNGTATLSQVICARDDIMNFLISMGVDKKISFEVMEKVRKGKGIPEKYLPVLKEANVPQWYIDSCQKIKYMFPKAHAVAYVTMAVRIAYFKVYWPLYFYSAYFSIRMKKFPYKIIIAGRDKINIRIQQLQTNKRNLTALEKEELETLKIVREMYARGIKFENVDLFSSDSKNFIPNKEKNTLLIPFSAIDGIGQKAADNIVKAREQKRFTSWEDLKKRASLTSANIETLKQVCGSEILPESNQRILFAH